MNRRDFVQRASLALTAPMLLNPSFQQASAQQTSADEGQTKAETIGNSTPLDENFVLLFSDPHDLPGVYVQDELIQRLEMIRKMNPLPAYLICCGDFAWEEGEPASYADIRRLLQPFEELGIQWETVMGNHDRRETFWEAFPEKAAQNAPVPGKYVSIVETPKADFILLDSLLAGKVEGAVDEEQRQWLEAVLAGYQKPVFVGAHHSLAETQLTGLLRKYPCVAGYIHGHHHYWEHTVTDGLPEITIPSTGCWGDIGYVGLNLSDTDALFRLNIFDCYKFNTNEPEENRDEILRKKRYEALSVPLYRPEA